ncbi:protein PHYTOCHROME KINASE SUBSTRATE 4-like [Senna tora]|uniref:Protein PHYTOCHROME KINASE SUBSTRATE 4-like n=1 Tax=Senna tora TaxID=362788 RepID=A0A834SFH5_9FABA|nr:protein PHYTOCHROME KINASE SUBSTRATE 4-like [Senna tora]
MGKARVMKTFHKRLTVKSPILTHTHASFSYHLTPFSIPTTSSSSSSSTNHHNFQGFNISTITTLLCSSSVSSSPAKPASIMTNSDNNPPSSSASASVSSCSKGLKSKIRASLSKPIRFFRRKCPCSDKKSVQVKERGKTERKSISQSQNRDKNRDGVSLKTNNDGFTFPVLKSKTEDEEDDDDQEKRRDSLQDFRTQENNGNGNNGGPSSVSASVSQSPKSGGGGGGGIMMEDDVASDASSDLFEIQNLSTQPTSEMVAAAAISRRRNANGEAHREMG